MNDHGYNNSNTNYSSDLNGVVGQTIWIEQTGGTARINGNTTIGSATQPVILIVNGNFKAKGNTTIYGIVYVAKNWNNGGGGNLNIIGAAVVEGNFSGKGSPNITYDPTVLNRLQETQGVFVKIPGTWRDF